MPDRSPALSAVVGRLKRLPPVPATLALNLFVLAISTIVTVQYFPAHYIVSLPLHAFVEGLGFLAAITLGAVLLVDWDLKKFPGSARFWLAVSLIGMGMISGLQGVVSDSRIFPWLHGAANLVGGTAFAFVWTHAWAGRGSRRIAILTIILAVTLASTVVLSFWPGYLTNLTTPEGYNIFAIILSVVGGAGFLVGSAYFLLEDQGARLSHRAFFTNFGLVFGLSALFYGNWALWTSAWWLGHGFRVAAYTAALGYVYYLHLSVGNALRKSEASLSSAQRIARLGSWEWDISTGALEWSDETYRIFGLDREKFHASIDTFLRAVHPDDRQRVQDMIDIALNKRGPYSIEHRIIRPDGSIRIIREQGEVRCDDKGNPVAMIGAAQDVTERERAEHALDEKRKFVNAVVESVGAMVMVLDASGKIVRFNEASECITGFRSEEVLGRHIWSLLPSRSLREQVREEIESFRAGRGPGLREMKWITRDGSERIVEWVCTVLRDADGKVSHVVATGSDVTERRAIETALRSSERRYALAARFGRTGVWEMAPEEGRLYADENLRALVGYGPDELSDRLDDWLALVHPADRREVRGALRDVVSGQSDRYIIEHRVIRKDGTIGWLYTNGKIVSGEDTAEPRRLIGTSVDITERRRAEEETRLAATVFQNSNEAILIADADRRILKVNRAFTRITGFLPEEAEGQTPNQVLRSGQHDELFYKELWDTVHEAGNWQGEVWNRRKTGEVFPAWQNISAVRDERGQVIQYIGIFTDITDKKLSEERIQHLAHFDILTDLPNRVLFNDRFEHAIERARRGANKVGLLFLDLDRFKNVNDTLGHPVGDKLLKEVSRRLRRCVRHEDTVARLGGDEFTVLLEEIQDSSQASLVAHKILEELAKPMQLDEHFVVISASIGISVFPDDGKIAETLLKHADVAMYRAKELGRNNYQFYTPELTRLTTERFDMESALRLALERNEFVLYYQPQVSVSTGKLTGVEALLRWHHPRLGMVLPARFIRLAEETGLIERIGRWVLQTAARQAIEWSARGLPPFRIAVNLSGQEIISGSVILNLKEVLDTTGIDPGRIELEISEGFVMDQHMKGTETLKALRNLGVELAIDDFGTGYSSLSYLKKLPIQRLKIDRTFVRGIPDDSDDNAITSAILAMAKSLNLKVIAEGAETLDQVAFLRAHDCQEIQGLYFGKPLPPEALEQWARERRALAS